MQQYIPDLKTVFTAKKEEDFNFEFDLGEYLPSISEIIKTTVCCESCTLSTNANICTASLGIKISVIYLSDFNAKIKNAVFRQDIHIDIKTPEEFDEKCIFVFSHNIPKCQAKQITTRKLSVSFTVNAALNISKKVLHPIFCPEEHQSICTLGKTVTSCEKNILPEQYFDFPCELNIDAQRPAAADVIFCDGVFSDISCKIIDSVCEVNAVLTISALYEVSKDEADLNSAYETVSASFAFSKTLESDIFENSKKTNIYLCVNSVEPSVSFDPYGENRVISFNTKYSIGANTYSETECNLITDAFIEKCASNTKTEPVSFESFVKPVFSKTTQSTHISGDFSKIQSISDTFCKIQAVNFEQNEAKLFAAIKCNVDILAQSVENRLIFPSFPCILHVPVPDVTLSSNELIPEIFISVPSVKCYLKDGKLYGDFDVVLDGTILDKNTVDTVSQIEKIADGQSPRNDSNIIIYYPPKDESLWNIAKKYSTNPEKIKSANKLEGKEPTNKKFLLIP